MLSNLWTSHLKQMQTAWPKFDTAGREKRKAFFFWYSTDWRIWVRNTKKGEKRKWCNIEMMHCRKKQQQLGNSEKKIPSIVPFWGSPQQIEFTRGFYVGCPSWHNTSIYPKLGLAQGCNLVHTPSPDPTQFSYWVLFWKYAPFPLGTRSVSQMSPLLHLLLSFLSPNVGPAVPASCSSGFPVVAFPPQLSIFTGERRSPKSSHQPANQTEIRLICFQSPPWDRWLTLTFHSAWSKPPLKACANTLMLPAHGLECKFS